MNSNCVNGECSKLDKKMSVENYLLEQKNPDMIKIILQKYFCSALHTRFIHRSIPPDKIILVR